MLADQSITADLNLTSQIMPTLSIQSDDAGLLILKYVSRMFAIPNSPCGAEYTPSMGGHPAFFTLYFGNGKMRRVNAFTGEDLLTVDQRSPSLDPPFERAFPRCKKCGGYVNASPVRTHCYCGGELDYSLRRHETSAAQDARPLGEQK